MKKSIDKWLYYFQWFAIVLCAIGLMMFLSTSVKGAEDNKTKEVVSKEWTTQMLYDTTNVCYQGTVRWIVISNPTLIGQTPNFRSRREMLIHCFCVMDRIKKEFKIEEYQKLVYDLDRVGKIFMTKATECFKEEKTLSSFFVIMGEEDNKTITIPERETDNPVEVPEEKTEDSQEESPDQQQEESNGIPETIFQG